MTYREAINALTEYAVSGTPFDGVAVLMAEQRDAAIEELRAGKLQSEVARRFGVNRAMICRLAKNIS